MSMPEENTAIELAKIVADVVKNAPAAVSKILPVDKLIDTLARGVGLVYHPRHVKQAAASKAESLIIETNAAELSKDIRQRAKFRREVEALHHQANLESIAAKAEKYLPREVSPTPVDPGWTHAFADKAKQATRDDLQELWAKVLADEVSSPGSISTRTLTILEEMSAKDAERFLKVACACLEVGVVPGVRERSLVAIGLHTPDLVELVERRLIHDPIETIWNLENGSKLKYFGETWTFLKAGDGAVPLHCFMLTDAGKELLRVTDRRPIPRFAAIVESELRKSDPGCSISASSDPALTIDG